MAGSGSRGPKPLEWTGVSPSSITLARKTQSVLALMLALIADDGERSTERAVGQIVYSPNSVPRLSHVVSLLSPSLPRLSPTQPPLPTHFKVRLLFASPVSPGKVRGRRRSHTCSRISSLAHPTHTHTSHVSPSSQAGLGLSAHPNLGLILSLPVCVAPCRE